VGPARGCARLGRRTAARSAAPLALALFALACRTTRPPAAAEVAPAPFDEARPCVALVLGGGSARGFAHVGVISALEEAQVPIELVVGTSVGSLVGGLYASGLGGARLEEAARGLKRRDFFDFYVWNAFTGLGLAPGNNLREFVARHVGDRAIEDLPRPFVAVAVDLRTGDEVILENGSLEDAIRASTAIPGVFEPFRAGDRLLVDGGVRNNLPVDVARSRGADVVIAVDVSAVASRVPLDNAVDVLLRAIEIVFDANADEQAKEADVVVRPDVGAIPPLDFEQRRDAIEAGRAAARAALPAIEAAIDRFPGRARPVHHDGTRLCGSRARGS
jgi:NTE family protein